MKDKSFEQMLHDMFDHIWNYRIEHPIFEDTVGDLMGAVIEAHDHIHPKGKWIEEAKLQFGIHSYQCSHCGHAVTDINPPNFCEKCGCDMREEE